MVIRHFHVFVNYSRHFCCTVYFRGIYKMSKTNNNDITTEYTFNNSFSVCETKIKSCTKVKRLPIQNYFKNTPIPKNIV